MRVRKTLGSCRDGLAVAALALLLCGAAVRGEVSIQPTSEEVADREKIESEGEGDVDSRFELFPVGDPYRPPMAGPVQRGLGITWGTLLKNEIPDSGDVLVAVKFGGRYGLLEYRPRDGSGSGWQLGLEIAVISHFDAKNDFDALGWDGTYGLSVTKALGDRSAVKAGLVHISSHIGDSPASRWYCR